MNSATIRAHIGGRIKEARKSFGLTQAQLGELLGVGYQQVHRYEKGMVDMTVFVLCRFAKALRLPPAWFFEGLRLEQNS